MRRGATAAIIFGALALVVALAGSAFSQQIFGGINSIQGGDGGGGVMGPGVGGSTDEAVCRFDGLDGNIQNSGWLLNDSNVMSAAGNLDMNADEILDVLAITVNASGAANLGDDALLRFGTSNDTSCEYDTAQTPDAMVCTTSADSNLWIIMEQADSNTDLGRAAQTNPTLHIHSADAATATDSVEISHDQTNGVVVSQGGNLNLNSISGIIDSRVRHDFQGEAFFNDDVNHGGNGVDNVANVQFSVGAAQLTNNSVDLNERATGPVGAASIGKYWVDSNTTPNTPKFTNESGGEFLLDGDVRGPASAVDNRICLFDSTTGKLIKQSGVTISGGTPTLSTDTGALTLAVDLTISGDPTTITGSTDIGGILSLNQVTFAADDTTPTVGAGNHFLVPANTGSTVISDLDNPIAGQALTICGNDTNSSTITDGGNFELDGNITLTAETCLHLLVRADNDYKELGRTPQPTPGDQVTNLGSFTANNALFSDASPCGSIGRGATAHAVLTYDDTTAENCIFEGVMSDNYEGGTITLTVVYAMASATSGTVQWDVAWERIDDGGLDIDADSFAAVQNSGLLTVPATSGITDYATITFTQAQADGIAAAEAFRLKLTGNASGTAAGDGQPLRLFWTQ